MNGRCVLLVGIVLPSVVAYRRGDHEHDFSHVDNWTPERFIQSTTEGRAYQFLMVPFLMVTLSIVSWSYSRTSTYTLAVEEDDTDDEYESQKRRLQSTYAGSELTLDALEAWKVELYRRNLGRGAWMLFACTIGVMFDRITRMFLARKCDEISVPGGMRMFLLTLALYLVVLSACCVCIVRPSPLVYWPVFVFHSVFLIWIHVPPFAFTCNETIELAESCPAEFGLQARRLDCGLQGHTTTQMLMLALLVLPYLLPRMEMMHFAWVWITVFYLGSTFMFAWTDTVTDYNLWIFHFDQTELDDIFTHFVTLCLTLLVATQKKYYLDKGHKSAHTADLQQRKVSEKLYHIFEGMVPEHVIVPMLRGKVIADQIDCATILFIVISDFEKFSSKLKPNQLLGFLNQYFTEMDEICEAHGVSKIETVSEEYVAAVGVVPVDMKVHEAQGHIALLKRIFAAADEILQLQTDELQFKMGMHTGPVIAGVIGQKLPRYRLFGDTVNTSARMMQSCPAGHLQFGEATQSLLSPSIPWKLRGEVEMKGKGKVVTYFFDRTEQADLQHVIRRTTLSRKSTTNNTKGVPLKDPEFDHVLEEVQGPQVARSRLLSTPERWVRTDSAHRREVTDKWRMWFHRTQVLKKFAVRMDRQAIVFSILTLAEALHMLSINIWNYEHVYVYQSGLARFPIFLTCRVMILFVLLFWRGASHTHWICHKPYFMQWALVVGVCCIVGLMYISYDALSVHGASLENVKAKHSIPYNQQFSLIFVLFFTVYTGLWPISFIPSLTFIGFAVAVAILDEFTNLYISQIGKFLFVGGSCVSALLAYDMDANSRARFKSRCAVEETQGRIETILNKLMPPLLLAELRASPLDANAPPPSHKYKAACIAQSDLCGFTKLASSKTPQQVVSFMENLFGRFDALTDKHGVYKVETVGDAYIAGQAEQPLTERNTPVSVVLFGLDMIDATAQWASALGVNVTCRVGVHHGKCVGGIVGTRKQRYHLFGHFMTALDILEATSREGMLQVSGSCKEAVEDQLKGEGRLAYEVFGSFRARAEPQLCTSKGEQFEYSDVGGPTFLVSSCRS